MKILIAPDSFKESLSSLDVALNIEEGIKRVNADIETVIIPMADGGEGTVRSIIYATGGKIIKTKVLDPLRREIDSFFGITGDAKTAIIEMAAASGLELLSSGERNPMSTTSFGTGQLINEAVTQGVKELIIGLGGSATNDGGTGLAEALGVRFYDEKNEIIHPCGGNLDTIRRIDMDRLNPGLRGVNIIIATDVNNIMCGPEGASRIYGPQKGANEDMVKRLDKNLLYYGKLLENKFNNRILEIPGTGAAGGLAAGLMTFANSKIKPGFDVVCELTDFENNCKKADLIITGEGKIDAQTFFGKAPAGVLKIARKFNKLIIAITGGYEPPMDKKVAEQFDAVVPIVQKPCTLEYALNNAPGLIRQTSELIIRLMMLSRRIA